MSGGTKWIGRILTFGACLVAPAAVVAAQDDDYTTIKPTVFISPQAIADCLDPAPTVTAAVTGFAPGETVVVRFESVGSSGFSAALAADFAVTLTIDATGAGSVSFLASRDMVPDLTPPEERLVINVSAIGLTSKRTATTQLVIIACNVAVEPPSPPSQSPPSQSPPSQNPPSQNPPPNAAPPDVPLPGTGWDGGLLIRLGIVALAAGGAACGVVAWSRRRQLTAVGEPSTPA